MELREAIEEIRKANTRYFSQSSDLAKSVILEAIIDGTLIPTDACFNVDDGVLYQAMNDGYGRYDEFKRDVLMALEIRSADDVRREGYAEGYRDGFKKSGWEEMRRQTALIDTPQPKGGDDE